MTDQDGDAEDVGLDAEVGRVAGDGTFSCPEGYPIKGNASSMIAHAPGTRYYDSTIAEVCFATAADAEAQGYRLSGSAAEVEAEATVEAEPVVAEVAAMGIAAEPSAETRPKREPRRLQYAIIETGGKQYRVREGDTIQIERLPQDASEVITIERVLLIGGEGDTRVGTPVVDGATVVGRIDDHFRGEKIVVFKYKPKKRYRRRIGHRQELTRLTITAINV